MELTRIKSFHPDQMGPLFLGGNLPGAYADARRQPQRALKPNAARSFCGEPRIDGGGAIGNAERTLRSHQRASLPEALLMARGYHGAIGEGGGADDLSVSSLTSVGLATGVTL